MLQENNNYILGNKSIKPQKVVSIPVSLFESMEGKYFVGQSKSLWVGNESIAWAGLINPCNSDVDLYTNVFTVSNFSDDYLTAEIWLNANLPEKGSISHKVSPTNTTLMPLPTIKIELRFVDSTTVIPENGINVYKRIIPPKTTLVSEEDGKFIEPPGGNYVVVLKSSSPKLAKAIVAFGWWIKPRCCK
ncbi:hypothetical protein JMF89_18250 [Clostridiaceae bacterium UIB06]|nr:hypothetical protein [Clostridiaceae bacterium UIB06]